jgi:flavin reductase (DIM6/NTAB) family NADH-FMN oxidoreductase RutF
LTFKWRFELPVSQEEFRSVLGHFATGVSVVTARGDDGKTRGLTVSAFSSLSLDPPLILICIDRRASLHDHLPVESHFCVNILTEDQEVISRRFASKEADRFEGLGYEEGMGGAPLLEGSLATIECRVVEACPGGDHTIFIGQVERSSVNEGRPLTYYRGGYSRLA